MYPKKILVTSTILIYKTNIFEKRKYHLFKTKIIIAFANIIAPGL